MNEVDFVRMCRTLETGDLVVFTADRAAQPPGDRAAGDRDLIAWTRREQPATLGFVLRFVDPAKPLLVFRTVSDAERDGGRTAVAPSPAPGFTIDFFQDALYAREPRVRAQWFSVWRATAPRTDRWRGEISRSIGHPLETDTEQFDAYSAGAFAERYRDVVAGGDGALTPAAWAERHLEVLGVRGADMTLLVEPTSIWAEHDVYTFT